ncbi:HD domain-containing protein [Candidatus Woesearchaeota archaeon]|nr:HD domain-containing protein [Candidatus Woesearchaeota archaeon]
MFEFKTDLYKKVDKIQSKSLRKTVREILSQADEKFWTDPCSGTGKHHPAEDQGEAGLVRHLVKATQVFEYEAYRQNFEDYEFDAGMAATILHDIKKNGILWGENTDYSHGVLGYFFIKKFYFSDKTVKKMVMNAVRYHMAPWNTTISNDKIFEGIKKPEELLFSYKELNLERKERTRGMMPSRIEKAVQDADYWASRENMSFYPEKSIMPDTNKAKGIRKHDAPEEWVQEILGFNKLMMFYRNKWDTR